MSAALASNGSPTTRRVALNKSQSQENDKLEGEKGPAHKVRPFNPNIILQYIYSS